MLKHVLKIICCILSITIVPCYDALGKNNIYPTLYLAEISSNSNLDELFVEIIEHHPKTSLITKIRIPDFPHFWVMKTLKEIKNLPLWSDFLNTENSRTLHIIFKDQDFWSKDDIIGSIKLVLHYNGNTIKSDWFIIDSYQSTAKVSSNNSEHLQKIKLTSDQTTYIIKIGLSESKDFSQHWKQNNYKNNRFPNNHNWLFIQ